MQAAAPAKVIARGKATFGTLAHVVVAKFDHHLPLYRQGGNDGRKWFFAGSKAGGERAAAIYTVIETCKLNGVEPQAYIADVIAKIAGNWPAACWDELMPWNWRPDFQTIAEAA